MVGICLLIWVCGVRCLRSVKCGVMFLFFGVFFDVDVIIGDRFLVMVMKLWYNKVLMGYRIVFC